MVVKETRRTQLYVPGNNEKIIRKSATLNSDSIIFDLEDAVPLEQKEEARNLISKLLKEIDFGNKEICLRINPISTIESMKDLIFAYKEDRIDCLVVPKSEGELDKLHYATNKKVIALIETVKGFLNINKIIDADGVVAVSWGAADFSISAGGKEEAYSKNIYVKTKIVLAARHAGIDAIDKVYFDLSNIEGFKQECIEAKSLGFNGKQIIHPSQIEIANQIFSPSKDEIEWAKRVLAEMEKAKEMGKGAIRVDDKLIDLVHVRLAKKILSLVEKIGSN